MTGVRCSNGLGSTSTVDIRNVPFTSPVPFTSLLYLPRVRKSEPVAPEPRPPAREVRCHDASANAPMAAWGNSTATKYSDG